MSTVRPGFTRGDPATLVTSSLTRDQPDPSRTRQEAGSPTVTHIRMGRGMVAVKRYESEGSKSKRPFTPPFTRSSPSSPVEIIPGQETKRKWYNTPLLGRKRNVSLGSVRGTRDVQSWANAVRAQESWDEITQSEGGPSLSTITSSDDLSSSQGSSSLRHSLRLPTHRSLSSSVRTDPSSPFARPNELPEPVFLPKPTSPIPASIDEVGEDEDEDGRILLEALGLAEPTNPQSMEQPADDYTHDEYSPELNEEPRFEVEVEAEAEHEREEQQQEIEVPASHLDEPPTPTPIRLRPLPIPPQFRPPVQPQHQPQLPLAPLFQPEHRSNLINVSPPHDSQDAFAYVFGPTPRSSLYADRRESSAPPPPYVSRQSAMLDRHRPRPRPEDVYVLEQQLAGLALPDVPPLSIRRREDKPDQRRWMVENN
ncbi:hypothetical protein BDV93DRAFT_518931 [Ceratobasidium sp. AG-I]|nr:hypothetical protein BDV93DRAFT_518931 [Ceratobasidium sp. AG-I]